jgi:hypothetical protein
VLLGIIAYQGLCDHSVTTSRAHVVIIRAGAHRQHLAVPRPTHEVVADTRQVHILTTRTDLTAGDVIYRMGSRWRRRENYFRYVRMHFNLDSNDSFTVADDDADRLMPNPAKRTAHQHVLGVERHF